MDADRQLVLLTRALELAQEVISAVTVERSTRRTPCPQWDLRALVNHLVHDVTQFAAMTGGTPYDRAETDLIGSDWTGAFEKAARNLLAAWDRPGARTTPRRMPWGEVPGDWLLGQQMGDVAVHAWDVGKAAELPVRIDPELAEEALAWGRSNLGPQFRGPESEGFAFGREVPVAGDAAPGDRLVAFFGRDPTWSPGAPG